MLRIRLGKEEGALLTEIRLDPDMGAMHLVHSIDDALTTAGFAAKKGEGPPAALIPVTSDDDTRLVMPVPITDSVFGDLCDGVTYDVARAQGWDDSMDGGSYRRGSPEKQDTGTVDSFVFGGEDGDGGGDRSSLPARPGSAPAAGDAADDAYTREGHMVPASDRRQVDGGGQRNSGGNRIESVPGEFPRGRLSVDTRITTDHRRITAHGHGTHGRANHSEQGGKITGGERDTANNRVTYHRKGTPSTLAEARRVRYGAAAASGHSGRVSEAERLALTNVMDPMAADCDGDTKRKKKKQKTATKKKRPIKKRSASATSTGRGETGHGAQRQRQPNAGGKQARPPSESYETIRKHGVGTMANLIAAYEPSVAPDGEPVVPRQWEARTREAREEARTAALAAKKARDRKKRPSRSRSRGRGGGGGGGGGGGDPKTPRSRVSSASPRGRPSPYAEESTVGKHWSPMLAQQSPRQSKPPPRAPRISPTGHTAGFHPNEHMGMGDNTGLEQQGAVYHEETDPLNPMIDISVDESLQQPPSRALSDDDDDDDDEVGHGYGNGADEGQGAGAAHVDGDTAAAHGHETAVQEPTHSGADQSAGESSRPSRQGSSTSVASHVVSGAVPNALRIPINGSEGDFDFADGGAMDNCESGGGQRLMESEEERQVREILDAYYGRESVEAVMASFREENQRFQELARRGHNSDNFNNNGHVQRRQGDASQFEPRRPMSARPAPASGRGEWSGSTGRIVHDPRGGTGGINHGGQHHTPRRPKSAHAAPKRPESSPGQLHTWAGFGEQTHWMAYRERPTYRPSTARPSSTRRRHATPDRERPRPFSATSPVGLGTSLGTAQYHGNPQAARVTLDDVSHMLQGYKPPPPRPGSAFSFHPKISRRSKELLRRRGDYVPLHLRASEVTAHRDAKRKEIDAARSADILTFRPEITKRSREICDGLGDGRVKPQDRYSGHLAHVEESRARAASKHDNGEITHRPRLSKGTERLVKERGIAPIHERLESIQAAQGKKKEELRARNEETLTFRPTLSKGTRRIVEGDQSTFDSRLQAQRQERVALYERLAVKHAPPLRAKPDIDPKSKRMADAATREGRRTKINPASPKPDRN